MAFPYLLPIDPPLDVPQRIQQLAEAQSDRLFFKGGNKFFQPSDQSTGAGVVSSK